MNQVKQVYASILTEKAFSKSFTSIGVELFGNTAAHHRFLTINPVSVLRIVFTKKQESLINSLVMLSWLSSIKQMVVSVLFAQHYACIENSRAKDLMLESVLPTDKYFLDSLDQKTAWNTPSSAPP